NAAARGGERIRSNCRRGIMEGRQDRRPGVGDFGEATGLERGVRAIRAQACPESGLPSVAKCFSFPDDGEAARIQRRAVGVFGEESTAAKSLVSRGRFS